MNGNDIIKALECCVRVGCRKCEYKVGAATCIKNLMVDTADLINRQKAEIERLEAEADCAKGYADALVERAKAEAIKEFAEEFERRCVQGGIYPAFIKATLNNLVKEKVGE